MMVLIILERFKFLTYTVLTGHKPKEASSGALTWRTQSPRAGPPGASCSGCGTRWRSRSPAATPEGRVVDGII